MDDPSEAIQLAETLLSATLPQRWRHTLGVVKRARIAARILAPGDGNILVCAAALHDIGYSPLVKETGFHALDGAVYLRNLEVDNRLCGLVAHHSCAYREAELRGLSANLAEWMDEGTEVRDALWWSDMTTTPSGQVTSVLDRIDEIEKRYGPEDVVTFFVRQAKRELVDAVQRTEERLGAAGVTYTAK
ncbi:HD domain-containing protein [Lentzea alba]|uniref:HD domain-containing protein n=1 Tax=Lentzea alba TaxID=2714351 RepID=UPI0039BF40D0